MINLQMSTEGYLSLRESVFKTLRKAILKGEIKPGERLLEVSLAKNLGVSRTPIREAMKMLEDEGLVTIKPRRGIVVAGITEKSLKDVLEVRKVIEDLAIELACERITDDQLIRLTVAREDFIAAMEKDDPMKIAELDEKFHDIIFEGSGNDKLLQLLNNLREQMYRYRLEYVKDKSEWEHILEEHTQMLSAIKRKNARKGKDIIKKHIDNQEKAVLKGIKEI